MKTQLARFGRLLVIAEVPAVLLLLAGGTHVTLAAVTAVAVPVAETTWRAVFPAEPTSSSTSPAK